MTGTLKMLLCVGVLVCGILAFARAERILPVAALSSQGQCSINALPLDNGGNYVSCEDVKGVAVTNGDSCDVTRLVDHNTTAIFTFRCEEGIWVARSTTAATVAVALGSVIGLVYCVTGGCSGTKPAEPASDPYAPPPSFATCRPDEIPENTIFVADRGNTAYRVSWTEPVVSEDATSVILTTTPGNGDWFEGLSKNDGLKHVVTYKASDEAHSTYCTFDFYVRYKSCPTLNPPMNSRIADCTNDILWGSVCTLECYEGYEVANGTSSAVTCDESQDTMMWTALPECKKITCPEPFRLEHGRVLCTSTEYQDSCSFDCDRRYRLSGHTVMTCESDRTWSLLQADVQCLDDEAPEIDCLSVSPQIFYADRASDNTSVTWVEPVAVDNVDGTVIPVKVSGPDQGDVRSIGMHSVTYNATDKRGNSASCVLHFEVKEISCPVGPREALSNDEYMKSPDCTHPTYRYGTECTLSCQNNIQLNGSNVMTCERNGTAAIGVWRYESANEPVCNFVNCPPLNPPENGAMTYNTIQTRPLYVMFCQQGLAIPSLETFTGDLVCQDDGTWYPIGEFPDCIEKNWLNVQLPMELYYEGNCSDEETQLAIKEQTLLYLSGIENDLKQSICPNETTCTAENIVVVCDKTTTKRKREASSIKSHNIFKRQTQQEYLLVTWDFAIPLVYITKTVQEAYAETNAAFDTIKAAIEADVNNGTLNYPGLSNPDFQAASSPNVICPYGTLRGGTICKPCPRGTFLNMADGKCQYCPVGQYMNESGATACHTCPGGYSTIHTGTKNESMCKELCQPGFVSSDTMQPCSACPEGTYQPSRGQESCVSCPGMTTTASSDSTSQNDCQLFDIKVGEIDTVVQTTDVLIDNSSVQTLSLWVKQLHSLPSSSWIKVIDKEEEAFSVQIDSSISLFYGNSSVTATYGSSLTEWNHILATVNIATGYVGIYVNGILASEQSGVQALNMDRFEIGRISLETNGTNEILMSGVALYPRAVTASEISTLLSSCHTSLSGGMLTLASLIRQHENIIPVLPTSCDPVNECETNPCGEHRCINEIGGFRCECFRGFTGATCDVPPDYCRDHQCHHGECLNGNGTYRCNCSDGYKGAFCNIPPVNGGLSLWTSWSQCNNTFGGGPSLRTRECNNPVPEPFGTDCVGVKLEQRQCPECSGLSRVYGTTVTCVNDISTGLRECNMTCVPGLTTANGLPSYKLFTCGLGTGFKWQSKDFEMTCIRFDSPNKIGIDILADLLNNVPKQSSTTYSQNVRKSLSNLPCVENNTCSVGVDVTSNARRKRSVEQSTVTIKVETQISVSGELDVEAYANNKTISPEFQGILDSFQGLIDVIEYIENNPEDVYKSTVDGVEYAANETSVRAVMSIYCPEGHVGVDGLCVECPVGTYQQEVTCTSCPVGEYQPLTGQASCEPCPDGYITSRIGSVNASQCLIDPHNVDVNKDGGDPPDVQIGIIVGALVGAIVAVIIIGCIFALCWKKMTRQDARTNPTKGSFANLNMIRTETSMSNDSVAKPKFDKNMVRSLTAGQLSLSNQATPVSDDKPVDHLIQPALNINRNPQFSPNASVTIIPKTAKQQVSEVSECHLVPGSKPIQ